MYFLLDIFCNNTELQNCVYFFYYEICVCSEVQEDDDETVAMIKELLDTRIRYVGDTVFLFMWRGEGGGIFIVLCIFYHTKKT